MSVGMVGVGTIVAVGALAAYVRGWFARLDELEARGAAHALSIVGVVSRREKLDEDENEVPEPGLLTPARLVMGAAVIWLGLGLGFAMMSQGFGFCKALYYVVGAMSSAGLQAPNTVGKKDRVGAEIAVFAAGYVAVGVPLFFAALGATADLVVADAAAARSRPGATLKAGAYPRPRRNLLL